MPTTPFTAEHHALRDSARRLVNDHLLELAARAEAGEPVQPEAVAACRDLGLIGTGDVLADVVIAEELGRVRSGGLTAVVLAVMAAADAGVTSGNSIITVAEDADVRIDRSGASGELAVLPAGAIAAGCLLLGPDGCLIAADQHWQAVPVVSPHALRGAAPADVYLDGAAVTPVDTLADVQRNHELRTAAAAVSAGWQTWEDAKSYAEQRVAFGRPIGRFQVNRHAMAAAATRLVGVEALVHDTAWARSCGREIDTAALRLAAGTVAGEVADLGLQLHGGFGYTTDFDVARAWRDAHALRNADAGLRQRLSRRAPRHQGVAS